MSGEEMRAADAIDLGEAAMAVVTRWNGAGFMHRCKEPEPQSEPPQMRERIAPEIEGAFLPKTYPTGADDEMPRHLFAAPPRTAGSPAPEAPTRAGPIIYEHTGSAPAVTPSGSGAPASARSAAEPLSPSPPTATATRAPAKALYDYAAQNPDEMSLRQGEDVLLHMGGVEVEPGWVLAEKTNGNRGMVPHAYVGTLQPHPFVGTLQPVGGGGAVASQGGGERQQQAGGAEAWEGEATLYDSVASLQ